MTDLKGIDVNNPKYIQLSQQQRKLKDDAKVLEDSLFALSKRVPQIQSMVNQEIASINRNAEQAIGHLEDRQVPVARSEQQYVMTSVNNLALMLSEALQQMQQQMQSQKPANSACKKPGKGKPSSSASMMRKMQEDLNKQMQKMKDGMKPGDGQKKPGQGQQGQRGMSEQLAKMAAQQEALRQMMQEMNNEKNGDGKLGNLGDAMKKMEETERDLVNKRITEETMKRQQDILTRLLESERAEREREQEEKRESNTAKDQIYRNPAQFEEFKKQQTRETELLKTVPPTMNSFYKNLVNSYFQGGGN